MSSGFGFSKYQQVNTDDLANIYKTGHFNIDQNILKKQKDRHDVNLFINNNDTERYKMYTSLNNNNNKNNRNTNNQDGNLIDMLAPEAEVTPVNIEFCSRNNIDHLQSLIKQIALNETNIKISDQSEDDLKAIMRSVYLDMQTKDQYNTSLLVENLYELNKQVIKELIPGLLSNIRQYIGYVHDKQKGVLPFSRTGVNVNTKGTKQLETFTFADSSF
jgi:hypothetical protein